MRIYLTALLFAASLPPCLHAQATAASSRPWNRILSPDGTVHYAVTVGDIYETGSAVPGDSLDMVTLSGDLSYQSPNSKRPLGIVYSGGWEGSVSGDMPSTQFHNLGITQGFQFDKAAISLSNQLSYMPEAPSVGLSGLPGLGDLGMQGEAGPSTPAPTILSGYAQSLNEMVTGTVARQLDHADSLVGSSSWGHLYFLNGNGLATTQRMDTVGVNRRLSALSSAGVNYSFASFSYGGYGYSFQTHTISLSGQRQWSRSLTTSGFIGPQWIISSGGAAIPSQTGLAISGNLAYSRRLQSFSVSYMRGSNAGSGILPGAISSTFQAQAQQSFRRVWGFALVGGFTSTSGIGFALPGAAASALSQSIDTRFLSAQSSRALGRSFSAYLSYTLQFQSLPQSTPAQNAFNGQSQFIGAGITFSPSSKHLGQL